MSNGKFKSERHHTFLNGSQKERDKLKYMSGFGPIGSETEVPYVSLVLFFLIKC